MAQATFLQSRTMPDGSSLHAYRVDRSRYVVEHRDANPYTEARRHEFFIVSDAERFFFTDRLFDAQVSA